MDAAGLVGDESLCRGDLGPLVDVGFWGVDAVMSCYAVAHHGGAGLLVLVVGFFVVGSVFGVVRGGGGVRRGCEGRRAASLVDVGGHLAPF